MLTEAEKGLRRPSRKSMADWHNLGWSDSDAKSGDKRRFWVQVHSFLSTCAHCEGKSTELGAIGCYVAPASGCYWLLGATYGGL
jgi:hypothetical protein